MLLQQPGQAAVKGSYLCIIKSSTWQTSSMDWATFKAKIDQLIVWGNREPILTIRRVVWVITTGAAAPSYCQALQHPVHPSSGSASCLLHVHGMYQSVRSGAADYHLLPRRMGAVCGVLLCSAGDGHVHSGHSICSSGHRVCSVSVAPLEPVPATQPKGCAAFSQLACRFSMLDNSLPCFSTEEKAALAQHQPFLHAGSASTPSLARPLLMSGPLTSKPIPGPTHCTRSP